VNRRILGRTGLAVSEIGFGAWAIGGDRFGNSYGPTDDAEAARAIRRAVDLGCNFFDTADVYGHGHSETLLGEALQGMRDKVILATKVGGNFYNRDVHPLMRERIGQATGQSLDTLPEGAVLPVTHDTNFSPGYIRFAVEQSLKRLKTDYLDLLQLHNPSMGQISDMSTYEVLEDLKKEGLIRFYGVSVHPPEEGIAAVNATMPDTVQIVYNLARRECEDVFFPAARAAQVGVIAREPLANGFLAGRYSSDSVWEKSDIRARMPKPYIAQLTTLGARVRELAERTGGGATAAQLALRFVLDNDAVSVVIVGMKTVAQVDENLNAGN
jgi:aryl-alcohol dehydrogenase-like predicted oxidoreductase